MSGKAALNTLLIVFVVLLSAYHSMAAELTVQGTSGRPGQDITVTIHIDNAADLLSADITLDYDRAILTATGAETAGLSSGFIVATTVGYNQIRISLASATPASGGGGDLVTVGFSIVREAGAGTTGIVISEALLYGSDLQTKAVTTAGGTVRVGIGGGDICAAETLLGIEDPRLETLRQFRDRVLATNSTGRALIELYYKNHEAVMSALEKHPALKKSAMALLEALIPLIEKTVFPVAETRR